MAEPIAIAAMTLDAAIGWPASLYRRIGHPVGWFALFIDACERLWNRSEHSFATRRLLGLLTIALLAAGVGGCAFAIEAALRGALGGYGWMGVALAAWPALAQRSLYDHVGSVAAALQSGDLCEARRAVSMIVGRDTQALDEAGVARAAIESLAESFCDGIVAPAFWLLVAGLPGVWIYKACNTADSLIGHKEERWRAFGWAAARLDDLLSLAPARLAGALLCLAAPGGWRVMWRDARKHASPNAGWTEAAMAGALRLPLVGPVSYGAEVHDKPWIGDGDRPATADDVARALRIYLRACALLWIVAGACAWAL